ncbi:hypothetical protein RF11_10684 [Thelohanellus kitauei]|uniref:Transmembrane protein n=1 Tax=Thelohanellus kitauei TaxID=669202 RepID=A0A0C2MYV6_THEKT|nr:hypothetical protein RF11_10684 [Thelohanellus kitauei]
MVQLYLYRTQTTSQPRFRSLPTQKKNIQGKCKISFFSYFPFWTMYILVVGFIEMTIYISFHFSIQLRPFKIIGWVEGYNKRDNRCSTFVDILNLNNNEEPSQVVEPTQ